VGVSRKRRIIERSKRVFVTAEPVEHEPNCIGSGDASAFDTFMLPRIQKMRDEASREILEYIAAGRSLYDAIADALRTLPTSKTRKLRKWIDEARSTKIYAYAQYIAATDKSRVQSAFVGLIRTAGGPKDREVDHQNVDGYNASDVAFYWYLGDATDVIDERRRSHEANLPYSKSFDWRRDIPAFEKLPLVELPSKAGYDIAMHELRLEDSASTWQKPGLYDFRKMPPVFVSDVESYERAELLKNAAVLIDEMLKRNEWKDACTKMLVAS